MAFPAPTQQPSGEDRWYHKGVRAGCPNHSQLSSFGSSTLLGPQAEGGGKKVNLQVTQYFILFAKVKWIYLLAVNVKQFMILSYNSSSGISLILSLWYGKRPYVRFLFQFKNCFNKIFNLNNKFWFVSTLVAINLFQTFPKTDSFLYYNVFFSLSNQQLFEGEILISLLAVTGQKQILAPAWFLWYLNTWGYLVFQSVKSKDNL